MVDHLDVLGAARRGRPLSLMMFLMPVMYVSVYRVIIAPLVMNIDITIGNINNVGSSITVKSVMFVSVNWKAGAGGGRSEFVGGVFAHWPCVRQWTAKKAQVSAARDRCAWRRGLSPVGFAR